MNEVTIVKCPSCGMIISDTTTVCPACGMPVAGTAATDVSEVRTFIDRLDECDRQIALKGGKKRLAVYWPKNNVWLQLGWVILNIACIGFPMALSALLPLFGNGNLSKEENVKMQVVKNQVFFNPTSFSEGLRIADAQMEYLAHEKLNNTTAVWAKTWMNKAKEFYQLARQRGETNTDSLDRYLGKITKTHKRIKEKLGVIAAILIVWAIVCIAILSASMSNRAENRENDRNANQSNRSSTGKTQNATITPSSNGGMGVSVDEVRGTYVGETGSVIVIHENGTATYYWYGWDDLYDNNNWRLEDRKIIISLPAVQCDVAGNVVAVNEETVFESASMNWDDEKFIRINDTDMRYSTEQCDELLKQYFGDKADEAVARVKSSGMKTYECGNIRMTFPAGTAITDSNNSKSIAWTKDIQLYVGESENSTISDDAFVLNGEKIVDNLFATTNTNGVKQGHNKSKIAGYHCVANYYFVESNGLFMKLYAINEPERSKFVWVIAIATSKDLLNEVDSVLSLSSRIDGATKSVEVNNISAKNVTPTTKEALDKYEAFIDEYVAFMNRYNKATDVLVMYQEYMEKEMKLLEWTNTISALISVAKDDDALYAAFVLYRVSQKLDLIQ